MIISIVCSEEIFVIDSGIAGLEWSLFFFCSMMLDKKAVLVPQFLYYCGFGFALITRSSAVCFRKCNKYVII